MCCCMHWPVGSAVDCSQRTDPATGGMVRNCPLERPQLTALMPVNCWKNIIRLATTSCGLRNISESLAGAC